jgi:thiamine kinase-like enzyme
MVEIARNRTGIKILTPDGFKQFTGISRKKVTKTVLLNIDGQIIRCTEDHKIKILGSFIQANQTKFIERVIDEEVYVYDPINVGEKHEYLTGSIVNHNCVEFQGSSGTLISGWKLKELVHKVPLYSKEGLSKYEEPRRDRAYACIADVSRGKGLDYSAFSVIDVTEMPYRQVCTFRNNLVTPVDYADILHRVCKSYNNASVLVEINDIGEQVSSSLHYDFEYENILSTESAGRAGKRITSGFGTNIDKGIRTTKSVKSVGCSILKLLIEQNQLILYDFETISELSTFSRKGISYEAESGKHDDLVMGLVLFAWLSDQMYFKELTSINTLAKLREKTDEEIAQDMLPFGFMDDGMPIDEVLELPRGSNWMASAEDSF